MKDDQDNFRTDSLRSPMLLMARTLDRMADNEPHQDYKAQKRLEANKLRELVSEEL